MAAVTGIESPPGTSSEGADPGAAPGGEATNVAQNTSSTVPVDEVPSPFSSSYSSSCLRDLPRVGSMASRSLSPGSWPASLRYRARGRGKSRSTPL